MGQPDSLEQPAKVIGIIAEYNPFHGGHKFQIEEAKKRTGADWCVAAMSGDFVQRGSLRSTANICVPEWPFPVARIWWWSFPPPLRSAARRILPPAAWPCSQDWGQWMSCALAVRTGISAGFGRCRYPGEGRRGLFLTSKHWTAKRPQLAPGPQPGPA